MQTKTFTGKDQYDVEQQMWNWRNANPQIKVIKTYPPDALDLEPRTPAPSQSPKAPPQDRVSVRIDYETSN